MGAEENSLRNKNLYKIELYLLKVMPILIAAIYLINTVLSYKELGWFKKDLDKFIKDCKR